MVWEAASLFLMNLFAGLFFINEGLFHYDSVVLARAVETTFQTLQLQPAVSGRYGAIIINSILYIPFFLFGDNADFVTRFSSILFHSLSIVALYLFVVEFLNDRAVAFFTALLFSVTPIYFIPNTYGKEHGMAMFFLLFSFYLLLRGCRKNSHLLIGCASFSLGVSIAVRESMIFMTPLFLVLFFCPKVSLRPFSVSIPKGRSGVKFLIALVAPLALVLGALFFTYLGALLYKTLFIRNTDVAFFKGLWSFSLNNALQDVFKMTSVLGVGLFIMGMIKMFRREGFFITAFLLLWFMTILFYGNNSGYSPRYLDLVMVPVWIGVAYGIIGVSYFNKIIRVLLLGVLISVMIIRMYPLLDFRRHYNGEKRFAVFVQSITENDAVVLGVDDSPFIEYYGKRRTLMIPVGPASNMDPFFKDIEAYLKRGVPVYLMGSFAAYDRSGVLSEKINNRFQLRKAGQFLSEDFHRPEFNFSLSYEDLYKVLLK